MAQDKQSKGPILFMIQLRSYQTKSIDELRQEIQGGHKRLILQAPTGSGKTVCAAEIIRLAINNNKSVVMLAHRRELIHQAAKKLREFGLEPGIIMAGERREYDRRLQVASVQTLWARAFKRVGMDLPEAEVIIIDEAHLSMANTYQKILSSYPESIVIGLTATPIRSDGRGLGETYSSMVKVSSVSELTKSCHLVPVRYFAPTTPDLEGIKTVAGDYQKDQLEERMDKVQLVGDIVENWSRIAEGRLTVVFASGVKHSIHIRDAFRNAGIAAEHIDGKTPKRERDEILERLDAAEIQVVTNCAILQEGWDQPRVSCAIIARPTKSFGLWLQMAGRILRPSYGKKDALIIDHSGAVYTHGRIDEFVDWTLEKNKGMRERHDARRKDKKRGSEITCANCKFVYSRMRQCPNCGHFPVTFGKNVQYKDGYLYEVGTGPVLNKFDKQEWYSQLLHYSRSKNFQDGWAAHKYRARFGVWPRSLNKAISEPGAEVLAFIRKEKELWRAQAYKNANDKNMRHPNANGDGQLGL